MHEFGHTLGLQHGGSDGLNNKPNYLSVMNYTWQACQVPARAAAASIAGFSRVKLPALPRLKANLSMNDTDGLWRFRLPRQSNGDGVPDGFMSSCSPQQTPERAGHFRCDTYNDLNKKWHAGSG